MPAKAFNSSLFETFTKQSKDDWQRIAAQETESDDPKKKLSWKTENGIQFFPYYDASDVVQLSYLDQLRLTVGENSFLGNRKWLNAPAIIADNESSANKIALDHLNQGADGLFFSVNSEANFEKLLANIEFLYCSLFFHFRNQSIESFSALLKNKNASQISGALFWDEIPKRSNVDSFIGKSNQLRSLGLSIKKSDTQTELVHALLSGVNVVESFRSSFDLKIIFSSIAFSLEADRNFFETVAKLKVLRTLWFQIAQAYGVSDFAPADVYVHVRSESWTNDKFQPHANMLKATTSAMAAIIGGCDALTVLPEDGQQSMMNRIARNVSSILREESHLNKVADPLAGAYAVDAMVDAVAKEVWRIFQSNVNA